MRIHTIGDLKKALDRMPDDGDLSLCISLSQKHRKGIYPCRFSSAQRVMKTTMEPTGILFSLQVVEPREKEDGNGDE